MRMVSVVAVATVVLLAGCVGPAPTPIPTEAVSEPVFASEEEALAAAEEVFAKFLAAETTLATSGGEDFSGFDGLVTENQLATERDAAEGLKERGRHMVGDLQYYALRLQQLDQGTPPSVALQAYVCLDISGVKFVDASGNDLTVDDPRLSIPYEVIFVNQPDTEPAALLVDEMIEWTGNDFC